MEVYYVLRFGLDFGDRIVSNWCGDCILVGENS